MGTAKSTPARQGTGCARYIGRVGALAVALGIGAAVASTPTVAWADGTTEDKSPAQQGDTDSAPPASDTANAVPGVETPDFGEVVRRNLDRAANDIRKV